MPIAAGGLPQLLLQPDQLSLGVLHGEKSSIGSTMRLVRGDGSAGLADGAFGATQLVVSCRRSPPSGPA